LMRGDDHTLQAINRPTPHSLNVGLIVNSIKRLKEEISGKTALEVMLISSDRGQVANIEGRPLEALLKAVSDVEPDLVQLEVPYRPPSEGSVRMPSRERVEAVAERFAETLGWGRLWVYGLHKRRNWGVKWRFHESLEEEALSLLERRPCRAIDVSRSLGINASKSQRLLERLREEGVVTVRESAGETYYFHERRPQAED